MLMTTGGYVCAAMLLFGPAAAQPAAFEWPDPRQNRIILVNANQDIAAYLRNHPDWFSSGETVLDLSVPKGSDPQAAERQRLQITGLLRDRGMPAGTYTSGTTVEPLAKIGLWPYDKVPEEWMPRNFAQAGAWPGEPDRRIIDVTSAETRHALQQGMRRIWEQSPAPLRFVDNAASHSSTGGKQPWAAYCANIREIRQLGESLGGRLVFNISAHPALLSDSDAVRLMEAIGRDNGVLFEEPWGQATRKSPALTRKAIMRYRQLLASGIAIIVLPVTVPADTLTAWLSGWRQPSDRVYLGWSFWKQPSATYR